MIYKFNGFIFNSDSLVLVKDDESIEIRPNEAKLLALLLENADQVIAKEQILSQVWQGKVVSEQAVFQNISNLRNLFGNEAIKTFPKRGYQWQVELEVGGVESVLGKSSHSDKEAIAETRDSNSSHNLVKPILALSSILMIVFMLVYTSFNKTSSVPLKIAYIPIKNEAGHQVIQLTESSRFASEKLTHINHWKFMAAIELEYSNIGQEHPLILTGKVREYNQTYYLNFLLKGPASEWSGILSAKSLVHLNKKLMQHLSHEFIYQLVEKSHSYELKQATLSLAHQQLPDDLVVLDHLIGVYRDMGEFEKAMVLAEKLEAKALVDNNIQQRGIALRRQASMLSLKKLYDLSNDKLALAEQEFKKVNDLSGQADVWELRSKLAYEKQDYPAVRESLVQSALFAEQAKNVEQELHALTYLSVLAHKFKQEEDKYFYLTKAEQKMKAYQLPQYRFAKVPFHYAIYSPSIEAKEPHLKQVLEFTRLTPDHWVAQSSRQQLVKYYLEQERFDEAANILAQARSDNAENSYLKTLFALANQDQSSFVKYAKKTFEQAELSGDKELSLNAALMLCEQPNVDANVEFYSQYITENATQRWRQTNERKLLTLSL